MSRPLDILVFGAHADDAEIGMGGTILKHTRRGDSVGICDLTYAEMSSNGTVESRREEAEAAAKVLGLAFRSNLGLPDRGLFLNRETVEAVALEIRRRRPRIVFAPYWKDRHPDHVMASQLIQEAVFTAKLRRYLPDTEAWGTEAVYFYFINDAEEADLMVDVTDVYEGKRDALRAYRTQFEAGQAGEDRVLTPLNQGYLERVEARDRVLGMKRQVEYAEGFVTRLPYLVDRF
ncbi:bacillithiol biosynthesis deacetylase BshB1 [Paenibacillus aurantius]|uniref:Bacillithiol biosynthesis deacetylase BshB1 n=1 Tax=Paenibacillus aurantius TaxID=2918900 RepID=A0AA96LCJ3_9BACL|nr:bacillithiol biosynthesis deacetylase BshB1 [Paenibacillus aurantius]WNQ09257.1 bacillithiol biosynthesis deacetylase BshB1 [Paenibacillus aurantius]